MIDPIVEALANWWESETWMHSNLNLTAKHPAYALMQASDEAIELALGRLTGDRRPGWLWFLFDRVGPIDRDKYVFPDGRIDAMSAAWIQWGRDNGYS